MAGRHYLGETVFDAALRRLEQSYRDGARVVVSNSGGKDSIVCTELAVIAARKYDMLPVDVIHRDEEIIYPGTPEYLERLHERGERTGEVRLFWANAHQPIINAFDRQCPYFWVFDPALDPDDWVRKPPPYAVEIPEINIQRLTTAARFPPWREGGQVHGVVGLRGDESAPRMMGIHSAGGYFTGIDAGGVYGSRPIYDWTEGDVWKAIHDFGWDYNSAYDVMLRAGVGRRGLRIAPPTMNPGGADMLRVAAQAWPKWWDRVCRRVPSVRTFAQYGKRAIQAERRVGETWRETFLRECIDRAPQWIADRAELVMEKTLSGHARHSTTPLPETSRGRCSSCGLMGAWQVMTDALYLGDPFSTKASMLPYVDPEVFRPGAGYWSGRKGVLQGSEWTRKGEVKRYEPGTPKGPSSRREEGAGAGAAAR